VSLLHAGWAVEKEGFPGVVARSVGVGSDAQCDALVGDEKEPGGACDLPSGDIGPIVIAGVSGGVDSGWAGGE
jgi:hypothetical protein